MRGILLMAYGGPSSPDQIEAYFTHIRGGRKPSQEQLDDLVGRYRAIGGASPLLGITNKQAAGLEHAILSNGGNTHVYAGMKHSPPFIADVMRQVKPEGVTDMLCIALAPHFSGISIGGYAKAVDEGNSKLDSPLRITFVKSWHTNPKLLSMWARRISEAGKVIGSDASLVFSAHSLPERILREGDPYKDQLLETSTLIAGQAGWKDWSFTFQSQSRTGEPWLGPDILDHLQTLYENGKRRFISAPIGFVSDHLEILYDIDIECKDWARQKEVELVRCESPNDSDEMIATLLDIAKANGFA
ncbi:MAG: ferrochelatase [Thaumarchaeota archaeon]|nr:ferrochelatase [Nitrososphaerota archaeon]